MHVPEAFAKELKTLDSNLLVVWHNQKHRWLILRRDPKRRHSPVQLIKVVADQAGGFMPLDRRTLKWLNDSDLHRQFAGRDERVMADLFEKKLQDDQAALDVQKEKAADEQFAEANDKAAFLLKEAERKGRLKL